MPSDKLENLPTDDEPTPLNDVAVINSLLVEEKNRNHLLDEFKIPAVVGGLVLLSQMDFVRDTLVTIPPLGIIKNPNYRIAFNVAASMAIFWFIQKSYTQ